jgi:hypothetical protein
MENDVFVAVVKAPLTKICAPTGSDVAASVPVEFRIFSPSMFRRYPRPYRITKAEVPKINPMVANGEINDQ